MNTENGGTAQEGIGPLLFSQADFPFIEPLIYLEPRVALPKPTRYYQGMRVDSREMRLDWSAGSMRALGLKNSTIVLLCKAACKKAGEPEKLDHYMLIKIGKGELKVSEANSVLTVSFKGHVDGMDIKGRKIEGHDVEFSFQHHNNDNAIVPAQAVSASAIYGGRGRVSGSTQVLSRFENYSITVSHFAPHPLLLQSCKELGFGSPIEMQKSVYGILKWHLL
ncbi:MAG: hypothetical protein N3G76_01095 [Candidatus Micrarchaeota archaeon]|nr:hypothetical protein [Candidatus Micrarchaeota archaeon]